MLHKIAKSAKWLYCKLYLQQLQHERREIGDRGHETEDVRQ